MLVVERVREYRLADRVVACSSPPPTQPYGMEISGNTCGLVAFKVHVLDHSRHTLLCPASREWKMLSSLPVSNSWSILQSWGWLLLARRWQSGGSCLPLVGYHE